MDLSAVARLCACVCAPLIAALYMRCIFSPTSGCGGGNQDLAGEEGRIKTTQLRHLKSSRGSETITLKMMAEALD